MRTWGRRGVATVIVAAGLVATAGGGRPPDNRLFFSNHAGMHEAPVVFVVLDELPLASLLERNGEIDEALFPNFARLAGMSTWYRNATSNQTFTKEALPALLTGSYPLRRVHVTYTYPRNLFSLLGATHEIRAQDVPANICPTSLCDPPPPPRGTVEGFSGFGHGERAALFFGFLSRLEEPDRPRLHFLHLVLPHGPWRYLPSGQRYDEVDPMPGEVDRRGRGTSWVRDRWLVAQGYQRHLLQTRLVDRLIGALLARLEQTGLLHEALVVVTADHGIGWKPGLPKRLPRPETAATLAAVPLFVKAPGQLTGTASDVPAETVDVLPTVADLLDAQTWPGIDGVSLADPPPPKGRERFVVGVPLRSVEKAVRHAVRQKYAVVGDDPWTVAPGTSEDLIGLEVEDVAVAPPGDVTAHVSGIERLVRADPGAGEFPAFFEGILENVRRGRPRVAIAVDGRIAAVTRAYESHGLTWFGAMLRPALFGPREERVELFVVDDVRDRTLTELPLD